MNEPRIQARGLTKTYRDGGHRRSILDAVDLSVEAGEIVVIVGRSGSGKSTLLNLLGAMDYADSGSVRVNGVELTGLRENERAQFRRRHVGFVFQAFNLVSTLNVAENLALPLELNGVAPSAARERVETMIEELQLGACAMRLPDTLSGGEQQRVAIGRALIHGPALVIADEPTGNLDLDNGRMVLTLLDERVRRGGHTLLMATHSREVMGIADRLYTIQNAQLRELDR